MTKKRRTRRALINSVISLLICFSMLLGTTFAWFTDNETSGINQIFAGNLDVELYHNNGQEIDGTTKLFYVDGEPIKWEPGVVAYENLTVKNAGNLALKYELGLNVVKENATLEGNYKLSDVLQYAVLDRTITANDEREEILECASQAATSGDLSEFSVEGMLEPGTETKNIALVIFWNPNNNDIDNLYNLNNARNGLEKNEWPTTDKQALHIDLGVNLYATQKMSESDSFGNDYDKNADYDSISKVVTNYEELKAAMLTGGNIVLTSDITVDTSSLVTDVASIPVAFAVTNGRDVVLDLNGHNITMPNTTESTAFIHVLNSDLTIKGEGTITHSGESGYILWAKGNSIVDIESGTFVATGADTTSLYASSNEANVPESGYATINVNGGSFENESDDVQDHANVMNHGAGRVNYNGGVYNWNPSEDTSDDKDYIKVAEGYTVSESGNKYYVVPEGTKVISNDEELKTALTSNDQNIVVTLTDNLSLNVSSSEFKLGGADTDTITINGNDNKLTLSTTYWSRLNMANPDASLIINNATITSSQTTGTWDSYDVTFNCNIELHNVKFEKALALDNPGKTSTLNNVTINETHDYYALWIVAGGEVTIDGLEITSEGRGIKIDDQYVKEPQPTTLSLSNATLNTAKKAAIMVDSSAKTEIKLDGVNIKNVAADNKNAVWVDKDAESFYDLVIVEGGAKVQEQ